jgi:photosystem II stability/assembly factor-like uncharacterized protein
MLEFLELRLKNKKIWKKEKRSTTFFELSPAFLFYIFDTMRYLVIIFLLLFVNVRGQKIKLLKDKCKGSVRGLSVVTDQVFWASGSNGKAGVSTDGGKHIHWMTVPGFEQRDFRDIEAFDEKNAIIMAVDNPAIILKTKDGGLHWNVVYEKEMKGMFLDAMAFDGDHGICMGDPIDGRFWIIETIDGGDTWEEYPVLQRPEALPGEAIFAASGTNIQFVTPGKFEWGFVTGGITSRLILMGTDISVLPVSKELIMQKNKPSTGAFSWAVSGNQWFVAGGDYKNPKADSGNHVFTLDAAKWQTGANTFNGYKSCVCWINDSTLAACGPGGVTVSVNGMKEWKTISSKGFNVVQKAKAGTAVYLAGGKKGRMAKLE